MIRPTTCVLLYATVLMVPCSFAIDISSKQLNYLQEYGYLNFAGSSHVGALETENTIRRAIQKFQQYSGIPATGNIDETTIEQFRRPRCGVKDILPGDNAGQRSRKKRFTIKGLKWNTRTLTWRVASWTNDLPKHQIIRTMRETLAQWQKASRLRFRYVEKGTADIMIRFVRNEHGDAYPFDGEGGTLAHAFFPGRHMLAGDTHFDDDELFTLRSHKGKNLYWVALHEFGHALGLDHTNIKGTVMFPFYKGYKDKDMVLHEDDIKGIQHLYGKPKNYKPRRKLAIEHKPRIDTSLDKSSECLRRIDSVTLSKDTGSVVVVNKDKLYIYDSRSLKKRKGPIPVSKYYPDGLKHVDASYTLPNGNSVYLQGKSSWEYRGLRLYREDISLLRRGMPDQIHDADAAFFWNKPRKVYIFKGSYYWRFNPWNQKMDPGYPKAINTSWIGVPNNIDSVFEWKKKVYFFKGNQYYRFNTRRYEVPSGYPKPIYHFFHCAIVQTQNNDKLRNRVQSYDTLQKHKEEALSPTSLSSSAADDIRKSLYSWWILSSTLFSLFVAMRSTFL